MSVPDPPGGAGPLVETRGLTKRYGDVTALDTISLQIPPGIVGLVGANGAGKSTLMKILLGLLPPTSGSARVLGLDVAVDGLQVRERVGYMPEHDCLPPDQSATRFVIHMARMSGLPAAQARERTAETLRHVGLFEERYRHIGGYSTGMRQRVKLAQALVHDPALLLLDEPTNGLDPSGRDGMLRLIQRTGHEFGISVIMASHLLGEIESVCDSLVLIDGGRLRRTGTIADLTGSTDALLVEVGDAPDRVVDALARRGVPAAVSGRLIAVPLGEAGSDSEVQAAASRAVVSTVAELGVPLVRLTRGRHTLGDLFRDGPNPTESP